MSTPLSQTVYDMALIIAASSRALSDMRGIRDDLARVGFTALDLKATGLAVTKARTMRRDALRMFGELRTAPSRFASEALSVAPVNGVAALSLSDGREAA